MTLPDQIAQPVLTVLSLQSLYALILFPIVWVMVKCCRGRYPRWQHALWLLMLLRFILPPYLATPWSAGCLVQSLAPQSVSDRFLAFPHEPLRFQEHQKQLAGSFSHIRMPESQNDNEILSESDRFRAAVPAPTPLKQFCLVVCCVYFLIVILLLYRFLCIRWQFWQIAGQAKTVNDPVVMNIVRTWCERLHIHRTVEVKAVVSSAPIYTMGLFRPVVILPESLLSAARRAALETVLAHELVHVKRCDDLMICLQEWVKIVYFFHPLVWFVMSRLTWTREAVCDGTVLSVGTISRRSYGKQLIAFAREQARPERCAKALAVFTSAAKGMAFRLHQIQKEEHMKSNPLIVYLTVLLLGLFLVPMAPMASSNQVTITDDAQESCAQQRNSRQMGNNALSQYILECVPCQNPEAVARIIWGDHITEDFQEADFSRLASATDCDIVKNIGNGQQAYVFYLLSGSRKGVYRPNFHFIMSQNKLKLIFQSRNLSTYALDRSKVNGRYEIEEGWRADFVDGINDDRVRLAWGSAVWFWSGARYLKAYTDYSIQEATDPSILGTKRKWERDNRSVYEAAHRK